MTYSYTPPTTLPEALEECAYTRDLLLSLLGSISLADHLGDVANDVVTVLERLSIETPYADSYGEWWSGLRRDLHNVGVTTLYGTELYDPNDEDDEPDVYDDY